MLDEDYSSGEEPVEEEYEGGEEEAHRAEESKQEDREDGVDVSKISTGATLANGEANKEGG